MNDLVNDIIYNITQYIIDYKDLYSLKFINKEYYVIINTSIIIKKKLNTILNKPKQICNKCVNNNCYIETKDLFIDYNKYVPNYKHYHQSAMNYDNIYVNLEKYSIYSPYCCECFKTYILFGDKCKNKIKNILAEGFVDIEYL